MEPCQPIPRRRPLRWRSGVVLHVLTVLTGPAVAISWVKDCPISLCLSLSGQPDAHKALALQCLPKRALRDLEAWKRLLTRGTTGNIQRKMFPLPLRPLHFPSLLPFPCVAPLPAADGGPESLRKVGGEAEKSTDDSQMD